MKYEGPASIVIGGAEVPIIARLWPAEDDAADNLTTDGLPSTWRGTLTSEDGPFEAELGRVYELLLDGAAHRARVRITLADTSNKPSEVDMVAVIGDGPAPWDETPEA